MDEIEPGTVIDAGPQGVILHRLMHAVPAHVRDLETLAAVRVGHVPVKGQHLARQQAKAVDALVLFTVVEQGLHADTDPQQRLVLGKLTAHLVQPQSFQFGHAVAHGTDPR